MNTILTILAEWNDNQNTLAGNQSQSDATDTLQIYAPTINDTDGDAWWVAVAVYLGTDLNIINPATYVGLRNYVNNNQTEADELFAGLQIGLEGLSESAAVMDSIKIEDATQAKAAIPGNITTIEGNKTGDAQLDAAYDEGIKALEAEDERLGNLLNG